jgi:hypothetical protein
MSMYVDAIHQGTISITSTNASNNDTFYIGIDNALANGWLGFIDEVKIMRSARTADEVKTDFAGQTPSRGTSASFGPDPIIPFRRTCVGYWKMDASSGNANDSSGNAYTLTNNGSTTYAGGKFGNGSEHVPASSQYFRTASSSDTYYFDASDGGPTDPNGVWADDSNAFNGSTSNYAYTATNGSSSSNYLEAEGTNAPVSGSTITSVSVRIYGATSGSGQAIVVAEVYTDGQGQYLGSIDVDGLAKWSGYWSLSTPTGGWTWEKVQSLETIIYGEGGTGTNQYRPYKVEILVETGEQIDSVRSVSFWTNPDALTNYYVSLTSSAYITSNASGVLSATGFTNPKIYVDGVLGNTIVADKWQLVTVTTETAINANQFYVGRVGSNYYDGTLDEIRLYNRTLSPAEVKALHEWAPGPLHHWTFDEHSGNIANDKSGNNNIGNLQNSPLWVSGKYGSGLQLNGSNQYVTTTTSYDNPTGFTIETWFKTNTTSGGRLIGFGNNQTGTSTNYERQIYMTDAGLIYFNIYPTATPAVVNTTSAYNDNKWHHVVVTQSATEGIKLYIDGVFTDSDASGTSAQDYTGYWRIGYDNLTNEPSAPSSHYFKGNLDDVRIYNYARTPAQIVEDMNAGHPAPGSPVGSAVAHWKFDEGYGDTAHNSGSGGSVLNGNLAGSGTTCPAASSECPAWSNAGKFNKALSFDETAPGDYVEVADHNSIDLTDDFTLSAWINTDSVAREWQGILVKGTAVADADPRNYSLYLNYDEVYISWYNTDWRSFATTTANLAADTWYHLVYTRGGGTETIYVNGIVSARQSVSFSMLSNSETLKIGRFSSITNGNQYGGLIDEVKLFNTALSSDQVKLLYTQSSASAWGALGTSTDGTASNADADAYCPPGQTTTCVSPVSEWKLDENTGTSTFDTIDDDEGTLTNNPAWIPGKYGAALNFNGSDTYVVNTNNSVFSNTQPWTISAWIKPASCGENSFGNIISKENVIDFYLCESTNNIAIYNSSNETIAESSINAITFNQWQHVTATHDGSGTVAFYVNSRNVTSDPTITATNSNGYLVIGSEVADTTNYTFDGAIDQVRIYDYVRTPAQIAWEYNRGKPLAWWKFDEGSGTTANDSSGNSFTGTLTNSPSWVTGKRNGALSFLDSGNTYVNIGSPTPLQLTGSMTVSAWIKIDSQDTMVFVSKQGTSGSRGWQLYAYDPSGSVPYVFVFDIAKSSTETLLRHSDFTPQTGVWYYVTGVYNAQAQTIDIYVDGELANGV